MTSTSRINVSGKNQSAHPMPPKVIAAAAKKMPVVERPALAREPPTSDPNKMPVKTHVLENEMTAPRRSDGDFHWRMAFSGTKMNELEIPSTPIMRKVPVNGGARRPRDSNVRNTPMAPIGMSPYSTRFREIRPTSIAPIPIPTDRMVSGRPDIPSDRCKTAFA